MLEPKFKPSDMCIVISSNKPETVGMTVTVEECLGYFNKGDIVESNDIRTCASTHGFAYLCSHETPVQYNSGIRNYGHAMEPNLMKISPDETEKDREVEKLLENVK